MRGKRVLEINPRHPIIKELRERVVKYPEEESVKQTAHLMCQTALMESGFMLNDPKDFASRIYNSVKSSLHISPDVAIEEEEDAEETEVESNNKEASDEDTAALGKLQILLLLTSTFSKLKHAAIEFIGFYKHNL